MLRFFRALSLSEGVSFLLILFVTMPLKYFYNYPQPNRIIGMIHGVLFIGYIVMVFMLRPEKKWSIKDTVIIMLCAVIPFGTFWMDSKYLKS